jgi:hypothetical protein
MKSRTRSTKWYRLTDTTIRRILVGMILLLFSLLLLFAYITRDPRILSWCPGPGMALATVYKYYFYRGNHPSCKR